MSLNTENSALISRRKFSAAAFVLPVFLTRLMNGGDVMYASPKKDGAFFKTRGIVISPADLSLVDWPERARGAGLTAIALHHMKAALEFIKTEQGELFLEQCGSLGIDVEYEFHAMNMLLPRDLFQKDPNLFRMNESGDRTPDYNFCVSSRDAVGIICENASAIAGLLNTQTGRYFFWIDDGRPMCFCKTCRDLSASEQALVLENAIIKALRRVNPGASLAHLAYANTLEPPKSVRPEEGVFLEFAPIGPRDDFIPKTDASWEREREALMGNLRVFPGNTAQVLEYWLDCSMWSRWRGRENAVRIPWDRSVFETDVDLYGSLGIRNITSFAVYVDREYVKKYGDPPLSEYGTCLKNWKP